ncbi:hypothetical protein WN55_03806 [Dufourea novaeangliae]|uniref:Uncharacterized protein n=1 Tax=Dufourea novaeangliae TaxID=178035 RepID=A0A154PKB6_DUFNO|nr:hypothetical protein WN55_03806 [Dufourea novaeangliae]
MNQGLKLILVLVSMVFVSGYFMTPVRADPSKCGVFYRRRCRFPEIRKLCGDLCNGR